MALLVAKDIHKTFFFPQETPILKGISLELAPQTSTAIIGKSGEGKTTLLHILGTLDEPTKGSLEICGQRVFPQNANLIRNRHIGFVFQSFHLIWDLSVLDNILMPAKIGRFAVGAHSQKRKLAHELIEMVGLEKRIHFAAHKLSGGERQRVALARAFINDPDIILADEPTGNLDHENAKEVQQLLFNAVSTRKKALLLVTHNQLLAKQAQFCFELEEGLLRISR